MGQFLMDKNCIFVDQFADVADNVVGKTWKLSVGRYLWEGRRGGGDTGPKAETKISWLVVQKRINPCSPPLVKHTKKMRVFIKTKAPFSFYYRWTGHFQDLRISAHWEIIHSGGHRRHTSGINSYWDLSSLHDHERCSAPPPGLKAQNFLPRSQNLIYPIPHSQS